MVYGADINRTAGSVINARTCCHVHHVTPSTTRSTARGSRASVLRVRWCWSSSRLHRVGGGDSIDTFTCAARDAACSLLRGAIRRSQCGVLVGLADSTQVNVVSRAARNGRWHGDARVSHRFDEPSAYGAARRQIERNDGHAMRRFRCSCVAGLRGCHVDDLQVRLVLHPQRSLRHQLSHQLSHHCPPCLRSHLMAAVNGGVSARPLRGWHQRILSNRSSSSARSVRRRTRWDAENRPAGRTLRSMPACVGNGVGVALLASCQVRFLAHGLSSELAARDVSRVTSAIATIGTRSSLPMNHNAEHRLVKGQ